MPLAVASARQALSIDPNIGEAHAVLAQINVQRGNLLDAESGFFFAISLEPNEPTPHHWYSLLLGRVGRVGAAVDQARRAHELDPTSPVIAANLANVYLMVGDDEQALRFRQMAIDLGISKKNTGVDAIVAMRRGQWDEARRLIVTQDGLPDALKETAVRYVDAVADPAQVPQVVAAMQAVDPKLVPQVEFIRPYMHLGQLDLVYDLLTKTFDEQPDAWVKRWDVSHAWAPEGKAFREDPRFGELARRMGVMVDYWKQYGFPDGCRAGESTPIVCS
jgi:tetratricopeptide (TPR) repeat protein